VVLLSGAASGLLARFFTHPLDTVKARLQVQAAVAAAHAMPTLPYSGTADALLKLARAEGVHGFYRGFSAVAVAAPLASAVYFVRAPFAHASALVPFAAFRRLTPALAPQGGYELSKSLLLSGAAGDASSLPPSAVYVAAGVVAQACAGLVYTPMDVVKERMQVQQLLLRGGATGAVRAPVFFASSAACLTSILRAEGARGAWRGYWAANAAWWPWNIIYFVSYEHLRDAAAARGACDKAALPPVVSALSATLAATLASVLTNPVDVVKTRLQALPGGAGALDVARHMYAREGAAAFRAGLAARVLSIAPGSFISFFAFESCRAAFAAREAADTRSSVELALVAA
jgi:solute carrier family 25 citrate transporter 1